MSHGVVAVVPSLGASCLPVCLETLAPSVDQIILVLTGGAEAPPLPSGVELVTRDEQLGFAAACNLGLAHADAPLVAIVNDDVALESGWLDALRSAFSADESLAAVQGTLATGDGLRVDGRGIAFDRFALPIQIDRGELIGHEPEGPRQRVAVSATAAVYRRSALEEAKAEDGIFAESFGSYHEDLDLGLRLRRLGWSSAWVPGVSGSHIGSVSGWRARWKHPWWLLANRWRALSRNLDPGALVAALPRLMRGELRAIATLARSNPRCIPVAAAVITALPWLLLSSRLLHTNGPRLAALPSGQS